jgi:DNA-binding transcriptional MerR regulator
MTIGQVAKATGVSASAIRFYESSGVLPQPRRNRGIRQYDPAIVEHLTVVRFFRSSGVSVESLATMFGPDRMARRKNRHAAVARRIAELDEMIAQARRMKKRLRDLQACECHGDSKKCVVFA